MAGEIETAAAAATAQLVQMKAAFDASPDQVATRTRAEIAARENDPYFQNKLLSSESAKQDVDVLRSRLRVAEAEAETAAAAAVLTDAQRTTMAIEGKVAPWSGGSTTDGQIPLGDLGVAVADLRALDLNPVQINQAVNGAKYHRVTIDAARALYEERMSNSEWTRKLAAGDRLTKREHALIGIVLNATCVADDVQADT